MGVESSPPGDVASTCVSGEGAESWDGVPRSTSPTVFRRGALGTSNSADQSHNKPNVDVVVHTSQRCHGWTNLSFCARSA